MEEEKDNKLKSTKAMIRSVLISEKHGVPASRFLEDYKEITGENIPIRLFGFSSVEDFIRSIPDVVRIGHGLGEPTYYAVADEATAHIQNLVSKQKSKAKPLKKGPMRFPKTRTAAGWRQFSRSAAKGWSLRTSSRPAGSFSKAFRVKHHVPTPDVSSKHYASSSLLVTIRSKSDGSNDTERHIERKAFVGSAGKELLSRTLKIAVSHNDSHDKKVTSGYEVPPRFQRHFSSSSGGSERPVAVVAPSLKIGPDFQVELPSSVRDWTVTILKNHPNGLWFSRIEVLYKEEYGIDAPTSLLDLMKEWSEIAAEKIHGNRYILRLTQSKQESLQPQEKSEPVWQDCFVPKAEQLPVSESGQSSYVYVSFLRDPLDFYVQEENSCVDDIVAKLGEVSMEQEVPDISVLSPGVFCAALYHSDKCWHRARVQSVVSSSEVVIVFIDYGNVEQVPVTDIRPLTKETSEIPAQAISCRLYGLKPLKDTGWSQEALAAFSDFVKDQKLEAMVLGYQDGQCVVEIFKEDMGDLSLNQYLFEAKLADTYLISGDASTPDQQEEEGPEDLELPADELLEVVIAYVDFSSCTVRLVGKDFSDRLEQFEDGLAVLYQNAPKPAQIKPGSVCIASVDLLYHRVKIMEVSGQRANCYFVDHGYTEWFSLDQLRPLDPKVNKQVAYQAIPCTLAGLENVMKLPTTMTELIEQARNKICVGEVISRDPLTLMLYDTYGEEDININKQIAEKLVKEGARVNMEIFCTSSESVASETSRTSSPLSQKSDLEEDIKAVTSGTANVSLSVQSQPTACDIDSKSELPLKKLLYTWGLPQVSEAGEFKSKQDSLKSTSSASSPPVSGASTSSPPVSGASTSSPPVSGASTSSPPVSGASIGSPPVSGASSGSPPVSGASTSSPPVSGASIGSPPVSGASSGSPPVSGASTGSPPVGGASTSSPPVSGASTGSPPVGGASTSSGPHSSTPVSGETVNSASIGSSSTNSAGVSDAPTTTASASTLFHTSPATTTRASEELQVASIPGLVPLPACGKFFCVYVEEIYDPSNFVLIPESVLSQFEDMMDSMNTRFPKMTDSGDASQEKEFDVVKNPTVDSLYMARVDDTYCRAIFAGTVQNMYRLYLPDCCRYDVVSPDLLFALPTPYWSLPFVACKARLHGVKPRKPAWSQAAILRFTELACRRLLVAMLRAVQDAPADKPMERVLSVSLVDTSDPERDLVLSDDLVLHEMAVADW